MIEIKPVQTKKERRIFLTFPWRIYKDDPLWVPPLLLERAKVIDPQQGLFFKDGTAEFFIAWKDGRPAGTLCLAEDKNNTRAKGYAECMYGFVEVVEDYDVFKSMFEFAESWARRSTSVIGSTRRDFLRSHPQKRNATFKSQPK